MGGVEGEIYDLCCGLVPEGPPELHKIVIDDRLVYPGTGTQLPDLAEHFFQPIGDVCSFEVVVTVVAAHCPPYHWICFVPVDNPCAKVGSNSHLPPLCQSIWSRQCI